MSSSKQFGGEVIFLSVAYMRATSSHAKSCHRLWGALLHYSCLGPILEVITQYIWSEDQHWPLLMCTQS